MLFQTDPSAVLLFSLSKNYFNREADGSDETNNKQTIKNRDRKISRFIVLFIPKDQIIYSVSFLAVSTMSVFSPLFSKQLEPLFGPFSSVSVVFSPGNMFTMERDTRARSRLSYFIAAGPGYSENTNTIQTYPPLSFYCCPPWLTNTGQSEKYIIGQVHDEFGEFTDLLNSD